MSKRQHLPAQDELRFQLRVSVYQGMGPFYDWLMSLPPSVRSRELLYLMRLGFSVSQGLHFASPGHAMASMEASAAYISPATSPAVAPVPTAMDHGPTVAEQITAEDASREQVEAFDAAWDIVSLCTPPPLLDLRRH